MPEQQKDMQSQKPKSPPAMPDDPSVKAGAKQNPPKKAGAKEEDEDDPDPSCGTGSCS